MEIGEFGIDNAYVDVRLSPDDVEVLRRALGAVTTVSALAQSQFPVAAALREQFTELETVVGHPPTTKTGRMYEERQPDGAVVRLPEGASEEEKAAIIHAHYTSVQLLRESRLHDATEADRCLQADTSPSPAKGNRLLRSMGITGPPNRRNHTVIAIIHDAAANAIHPKE